MSVITTFLQAECTERVGWTLLHSLWQIALVASVYALLARLLHRRSANTRYMLGCFALFVMILLPVGTFLKTRPTVASSANGTAELIDPKRVSINAAGSTESISASRDGGTTLIGDSSAFSQTGLPFARYTVEPVESTGSLAASSSSAVTHQLLAVLRPWMPWATSVWMLGVCLLALRPLGGSLHIRRLQRHGVVPISKVLQRSADRVRQRLGINRSVQFVQSALVQVPTVAGYLRPLVLLPATAITGLSAGEVEMILAHELAHIRRHDSLANLVQTCIEALLFYHPAMWWLSSHIRQERENCCDDIAISLSGNRVSYVEALARLELHRSVMTGAALTATGGSLVTRVRRILGQPRSEMGYRSLAAWLAVLVIIAVVTGSLGVHQPSRAAIQWPPAELAQDVTNENAAQAPENSMSLDERVVRAFRIRETTDATGPGELPHVRIGFDELLEDDPWTPQSSGWSGDGPSIEYALHMPLWELTEAVPVDLCFAVTVKVLADDATFEGAPVVIPRGEKASGYIRLRRTHKFWQKYNEFVPITITLKPTQPTAPKHAHLTDIWQRSLVSETMRAKAYRFDLAKAPPVVRELRAMVSKLTRLDVNTASSEAIHQALLARGIEEQTAYHVRSLTSLNPYNRCMGASVANSKSPDVIPLLIKLLEDTDSLSINPPANAAAQALTSIGTPAVPALVQALDHKKPKIRRQVVNLLNNMATNERREAMNPLVLPHLLPMLQDGDVMLREATAHALHRFPHESAVKPLIAALKDQSPQVRANAALALGWNRDARGVKPLLDLLSDPDDYTRQETASALGRIPSAACVEPLIKALRHDTFAYVRREAAWALAYQKDHRAIPALLSALQDADRSVVVAAAYGLGEMKAAIAVLPLIKAIDSGPNARQAVIRALGKITGHNFGDDVDLWLAWSRKKSGAHEIKVVSNPIEIESAAPPPMPVARPKDTDARQQFLVIERIARLPDDKLLHQLPHLYKDLAPRYMNPFVEGLISSHRSHILDRTKFDGPDGDHTTRWAKQLTEAASELTPEEVADKLEIGLWWNVAARARALQLLKKRSDATKALIDADLQSEEPVAIARASATILSLQWRAYTPQLLAMYIGDADAPEAVYRSLLFMNDPAIVQPLLKRVEEDPAFLARCAGLFQGPLWRKPAEPLLLNLLASPDQDFRYQALTALYECRDPKLSRPAATMASHDEPRFRIAALHLASNLPADSFASVRDQFVPLLSDTDESVKYQAVRCFAEHNDLAAADVILETLKRAELKGTYKVTVMQAMGKLASSTFNYSLHQWGPESDGNRRAIEQFESWLQERKAED